MSLQKKSLLRPTEEVMPLKTSKTKTITCPNCSKNMLDKTFKYYHSLKCHSTPTPKTSEPEAQVATHTVEFGIGKRIQARRDKYSNLFSTAS